MRSGTMNTEGIESATIVGAAPSILASEHGSSSGVRVDLDSLEQVRHQGRMTGNDVYRELRSNGSFGRALGREDGDAIIAAGSEWYSEHFGDVAVVLWATVHACESCGLRVECLILIGSTIIQTSVRLDRKWDDKFVTVLAPE